MIYLLLIERLKSFSDLGVNINYVMIDASGIFHDALLKECGRRNFSCDGATAVCMAAWDCLEFLDRRRI